MCNSAHLLDPLIPSLSTNNLPFITCQQDPRRLRFLHLPPSITNRIVYPTVAPNFSSFCPLC